MHTKTTKIIDCKNNLLKPFLGKEPSGCFTETLNAFIAQQKTAWPKLKAALQNLDGTPMTIGQIRKAYNLATSRRVILKYSNKRNLVFEFEANWKTLRNELPNLLQEFKVESMLDIPCGDFYWLKEVNLDFLTYTCADIVEHIIQENNIRL